MPVLEKKPRSALLIGLPIGQQRMLRQALTGEGFARVLLAGDGAEAAAILSSELVDIVFAPERGQGYRFRDVLGMIQGRGPNRRAPVVLLDEGMARSDIVSAIKAGAAGVLSFPLAREALRDLLARLDGVGESPDAAPASGRDESQAG